MQLQQGLLFRGCSHSFMFRLPYSLDPPVAPTAEAQCLQGSRAVYTTHRTCWLPNTNCGIATCPTRVTDTAGLSPARLRPCRPLLADRSQCFLSRPISTALAEAHPDRPRGFTSKSKSAALAMSSLKTARSRYPRRLPCRRSRPRFLSRPISAELAV